MANDQGTTGKKRGLIEALQTGASTWFTVEKISGLVGALTGVAQGTKAVIDGWKEIRGVVEEQFGTGFLGLGVKDETNTERAKRILQGRPDGLAKCMIIDNWLTTLTTHEINKFDRMIAEQFVDQLTLFTLLLQQALPGQVPTQKQEQQQGGKKTKKKKQQSSGQASGQSQKQAVSPEQILQLIRQLAEQSNEVMLLIAKPAADELEKYANYPDDEARTKALIAAHLKRGPSGRVDFEDESDREFKGRARDFRERARRRRLEAERNRRW